MLKEKQSAKGNGKRGEKKNLGHHNQKQIGGFSGFARSMNQITASSSKKGSKGVTFRPAVATSVPSSSSGSSAGEVRLIREEARATLQMGRLLGINYEGKEAEALRKISEMELKDLGRMREGQRS